MKPKNFGWTSSDGQSSVYRKALGVFTERATRVDMIKLERGGQWQIAPENAIQLFFVLEGEGQVNGENVKGESAIRLRPGTGASLSSSSAVELIRFVMPMFSLPTSNAPPS